MALFRRRQTEETTPVKRGTGTMEMPEVIDLRTSGPSQAELQWGMPGRCPECGDFGYLDKVDLVNEVMVQHCPTCWHRWETTKAEIEARYSAPKTLRVE